eukprot:scaffold5860_cov223-Amphora_coffeaeformis.AAC.3
MTLVAKYTGVSISRQSKRKRVPPYYHTHTACFINNPRCNQRGTIIIMFRRTDRRLQQKWLTKDHYRHPLIITR